MAKTRRTHLRPRGNPPPAPPAPAKRPVLIYALLLAATFAVYVQTAHFAFVNFDDPDTVATNPHVRGGLTAANIAWAFTSGDAANWLPLTRLSHILAYGAFGADAGGHHLVNALLHSLAVLLLFAFLYRATGRQWLSAWVALIFALHPLHVESVAWVSERKDVLSALFAMLALWSYIRWVERPSPGRYLLVLATFVAGLMSKPMVVTLPLIFLLLDGWPLARGPRWREKIPLFALAAASALVTLLVQQASGAVRTYEQFPLPLRLENAAVSCVVYLQKWFWPTRLAVFYPFPDGIPLWPAAAAALAIGGITALAWHERRRRPFLAVGWFWYLIMLAPVSGLVQVGAQARADRYAYLPSVGIAIVLAWGADDLLARAPQARPALAVLAAASCAAAGALAWVQTGYWRDSRALFQHAVDVTSGNYLAYHNLGVALAATPGGLNEAVADYQAALRIKPDSVRALTDLGSAYGNLGRPADAVREFRAAIAAQSDLPIPHNNLARAYGPLGRWNDAIAEYQAALRLDPGYQEARSGLAEAEFQLGLEMAKGGRTPEAISHLEAALRARPDYAEAHNNLGAMLSQDPARRSEAIGHFEAALRIDPNYADAHLNLGVALSQIPGRIPDAIAQLETADRIQPDMEVRRMIARLKSQER